MSILTDIKTCLSNQSSLIRVPEPEVLNNAWRAIGKLLESLQK